MSKIIVLGASGFVGTALMPLLKTAGQTVIGHSSRTLNLLQADAVTKLQQEVVDGDVVVLLSALTPEKGKALDCTMQNLQMLQHLLQGLEGKNLKQFVYVSSDAVYPITADMVDESTATTPTALYGQMHVMRECMVRERFSPETLTILRPCAIYGNGDTHFAYGITRFIRSAREQGVITLFGGGEEYRDHLHVNDFATVIAAAISRHVVGIYNVATGQSRRFIEIAEQVAKQVGQSVKIDMKPRAQAVTHRHVDVTLLRSNFPEVAPRSIEVGITELMAELAREAA